jgi:hypothetical protein
MGDVSHLVTNMSEANKRGSAQDAQRRASAQLNET